VVLLKFVIKFVLTVYEECISMSDEEERAAQFIIQLLRKAGPLTTREIEEMADREVLAYLMLCPDETIGFLKELKAKGLIRGKSSPERRSWTWWIE